MKVAVLDLGLGNLMSIKRGLERAGADVSLVNSDEGVEGAPNGPCCIGGCVDAVVLPGVGAFRDGMKAASKFAATLNGVREGRTTLLGICLGMQMLFSRSQEGGECEGLGLIRGEVVRLPATVKVPHMGWNSIEITAGGHRLTRGIKDGEYFYFVHSYYCVPKERSAVAADVDYGVRMPAIVEVGNVFGTQFHPEKSGPAGVAVIRNFLEEAKR